MKLMKVILILTALVGSLVAQIGVYPPPVGGGGATLGSNTFTGPQTVGTTVVDPINGVWSPERGDFNKPILRSWQAQLAKIINQTAGSQATIAYIGDSWTAGLSITKPLRTQLQYTFGDAGFGYVSLGTTDQPGITLGVGTTVTKSGTWAVKNGNSDPTVAGVDLYSVTSSDTATPAKITLVNGQLTPTTTEVIQWLGVAGGGSFSWAVDGGGTTTVNTSSATGVQTTTISGLSANTHSLVLTVTAAGTAGVTLLGVDLRRTGIGVRVHTIGHSGAAGYSYTGVNAAQWQAGLAALAPDVVVIHLGVNDRNSSIPPTPDFSASMATIISRVRTAAPLADIILVTNPDNGETLPADIYPFSAYRDVIRNLAIGGGYGLVDYYPTFGPYAGSNSRGLFGGSNHPNADGGRLMESLLANYLLEGITSTSTVALSSRGNIGIPYGYGLVLADPSSTYKDVITTGYDTNDFTCISVAGTSAGNAGCKIRTDSTSRVTTLGLMTVGAGGAAGKAICWKADAKTLGYCSTVLGADGSCTCN